MYISIKKYVTCMYRYMYTYMYMYVNIYVCIYVYTHKYVQACILLRNSLDGCQVTTQNFRKKTQTENQLK